jgi:ATP-dependent Clp protease ATP-binding subunit ClpC
LKYLICVLVGVALGWYWPRIRKAYAEADRWILSKTVDGGSGLPAPMVATGSAIGTAPEAAATEATPPLADKLRALFERADNEINVSSTAGELAGHPLFVEARKLLADESVPLDVVRDYAVGSNWFYSCTGLAALRDRADRDDALERVMTFLDGLTPWGTHFALAYIATSSPRPPVGAPLLAARSYWPENNFLVTAVRDYLETRQGFGDAAEFGPGIDAASQETCDSVKALLARVHHPLAKELATELERITRAKIDRAFLSSFGRFWRTELGDALVEPVDWNEALDECERSATGDHARSLMTSGEARVGKTSFLRLLARRLEKHGWTVFEASGADLMAGQQWFGQLEGRIQRTIEELNAEKHVIWYIPDILQIALSGTHQGQAASILDQILPAISAGRLIVWTEASAAGTAKLIRLRPGLRGIFEVARLEPMDVTETEQLAREVARLLESTGAVRIAPSAVGAAIASARQYLAASSLPGAALDLVKLTVKRKSKGSDGAVGEADIIETLAQQTGLPASILDSHQRVDLGSVRRYFMDRVMGQDEAVGAIVDRIAMLKAGLNDPGKPIGVFLFAGPTGTGKTELAKTLAEFLFGSTDRMIRLDMSEFQTPDSTVKILGSGDAAMPADSLITLVRKQPFSVVLLDEFEKAHPSVWDLFLQVFDDGRLTDQVGQVADFRHCIIILTSNLGATSHRTSRLGFSPGEDAYTPEQVLRTIGQTFRPEFQNRLDKVIVFQPLSRELMGSILKKELARVLDRRGFKDREWAVEWETSAVEFLLEKGFSPEMGARPLKRAIDQFLIAPLAATIVEQRFPEGDQFVFVRSDGRAIQAEFVDPDADRGPAPARGAQTDADMPTLADMVLAPRGTDLEIDALTAALDRLDATLASPAWQQRKIQLSAPMQNAVFWSDPQRYVTLSRLALIDRVRSAAETAHALKGRLDKGTERAGKSSRELISRLALQLHLVGDGVRDVEEGSAIEVVLAIEPAFDRPGEEAGSVAWCRRLGGMYRGWAERRRMQSSEVSLRSDGVPCLIVSGFGAQRTLMRESGLHVIEAGDDGEQMRATARVRIAAAPIEDVPKNRMRAALEDALRTAPRDSGVVRRYRDGEAPLVRDLAAGWRTDRLQDVLAGDFDLIAGSRLAD